uniref:Uncharacterized protein n=1 Tax=Physcomitrium patens TaxID=3218 RepID=A0A2K1JK81_PHYPA|nr:hypothetical protein PHYPA_016821 [Physcomitrium patens]
MYPGEVMEVMAPLKSSKYLKCRKLENETRVLGYLVVLLGTGGLSRPFCCLLFRYLVHFSQELLLKIC